MERLSLKQIEETPSNQSNHMIPDLPFPPKINYKSDTKNNRKTKLNESPTVKILTKSQI